MSAENLPPPPAAISDGELARLQGEYDAARLAWEEAQGAVSPLIRQLVLTTTSLCVLARQAHRAGNKEVQKIANAAFDRLFEIEKADEAEQRHVDATRRVCAAGFVLDRADKARACAEAAAAAACPCHEAVMGEAAKGKGSPS
jgi:hypothetical protein